MKFSIAVKKLLDSTIKVAEIRADKSGQLRYMSGIITFGQKVSNSFDESGRIALGLEAAWEKLKKDQEQIKPFERDDRSNEVHDTSDVADMLTEEVLAVLNFHNEILAAEHVDSQDASSSSPWDRALGMSKTVLQSILDILDLSPWTRAAVKIADELIDLLRS